MQTTFRILSGNVQNFLVTDCEAKFWKRLSGILPVSYSVEGQGNKERKKKHSDLIRSFNTAINYT